ncbi:endolytic transglycosylase MltG [Fibrella sp. HMF5335]|uniref:Endolytic murein transglycosylase n=1 Tax=Fibrella rubiginis TaxID=2817060 RepID=A0A939K4S8_9BACT|nr:endolytic transglycosylase MltG [Fibrella rubiginis]MBO0937028.1 endolytic transglycosylase MltG [Fibrella rubiginis]
MTLSRNAKIGIYIAFTVLFVSFTFYAWQLVKTPNLNTRDPDDKPFSLYIPKGATYESVLDTLKKHQIVENETAFRFVAKLMKYPQRVKAGHYLIKAGMGNYDAISKLRSGSQDPIQLTFNSSIRLKSELIDKVGNKFAFGPEGLRPLLNSPDSCKKYGFDTTTVICLFIPNTYELFWTVKPTALMERMAAEYKKFWNADRKAKAAALNLSQTQVQTLASIVRAETIKADEQPRVAGVYLNRLKRGIKLEADPTVIFANNDFTIRRVLNRHLSFDSPYNTYRYSGLPPGPINLPPPGAIDAVLNPEQHDYLFFVAKADFSGYHTFSRNMAEHMANARIYQQALNQRKIMK